MRKRSVQQNRIKPAANLTLDRLPTDPSPEEIEAACRQVRSEWPEEVRYKRAVGRRRLQYEIPQDIRVTE